MPYLKPSSASRGITVEAADVGTTLTISAPASVQIGQSFAITGILTRNDTGGPVQGASIALKYNGTGLGSASTGVDGDYLRSVSLPAAGSYTLRAEFAGMNVGGLALGASSASRTTSVVQQLQQNPLLLLVGIAALIFLLPKK